ncbi:MAG: YraN family protein [Candidatus Cloacimonetes bacterium]|nr:YraN family protein [Candidatus Cloacimonadota bacterium]
MKKITKSLAIKGEDLAANYLLEKNYQILERNYYCSYGEIDIIAIKENMLILIEVKSRTSSIENALNSVSISKQIKLSKTACLYLSKNQQYELLPTRFDVIAIKKNKTDQYEIHHLKDAFTPIGIESF